jgi:hypothetical protein
LPLREEQRDPLSGGIFGARGDGIFQVQDDGICTGIEDASEQPFRGRRSVEHAAQRQAVVWHRRGGGGVDSHRGQAYDAAPESCIQVS